MGQRKQRPRIAVLGGGAAGLSAAYAAAKNGATVDVFEQHAEVGGVLLSERVDTNNKQSFAYDLGAGSMQLKHIGVYKLLLKLRLGILSRDAAAKSTYVLHNGTPVPLPRSPGALASTPLLSARAKLRVLMEPLVPRLSEESVARKESVAAFFSRRFSPEFSARVADAAVAGIYAAAPSKLSMRHAMRSFWDIERTNGSLLAPLVARARKSTSGSKRLRESVTIDGGMQQLPLALADALRKRDSGANVRTGTRVRRLARRQDGSWRINGGWARYDAVVCALPAHALVGVSSNLPVVERAFQRLSNLVSYAPVAVSVFGYPRSRISHDVGAIGVLVPSNESRAGLLGVQFSSEGFSQKKRTDAERDLVFLTVYTGGMRAPGHATKPVAKVEAGARKELARIVGIEGEPSFSRTKVWHKGIPQYGLKHQSVVSAASRIERNVPGLVLAGNYVNGVGVSDAVLSGLDAAKRALKYVDKLRKITESLASSKK